MKEVPGLVDDLERWLRAAMADVTPDPPPGLLDRIWQRRRRSLTRATVGFTAIAAVIAVAVPSAVHIAQHGAAGRHPVSASARRPAAAPGTVLLTCGMYDKQVITGGELGSKWQAESVQAGPVWFIHARRIAWGTSKRLADGKLTSVAGVIVAVRNGSVVEITTPPRARSHFRFLTHATSSGLYTLHDGVTGLTLAACPRGPLATGMPESWAAGLTLFYLPLGYVTDLTRCLPMEVATPPHWRPYRVRMLSLAGAKCGGG